MKWGSFCCCGGQAGTCQLFQCNNCKIPKNLDLNLEVNYGGNVQNYTLSYNRPLQYWEYNITNYEQLLNEIPGFGLIPLLEVFPFSGYRHFYFACGNGSNCFLDINFNGGWKGIDGGNSPLFPYTNCSTMGLPGLIQPLNVYHCINAASSTCSPNFQLYMYVSGTSICSAQDIDYQGENVSYTITAPPASSLGVCPVCISVRSECFGGPLENVLITTPVTSILTDSFGTAIVDVGNFPSGKVNIMLQMDRFNDLGVTLSGEVCGNSYSYTMSPSGGFVCGFECAIPISTGLIIDYCKPCSPTLGLGPIAVLAYISGITEPGWYYSDKFGTSIVIDQNPPYNFDAGCDLLPEEPSFLSCPPAFLVTYDHPTDSRPCDVIGFNVTEQ